MVASCPINKRIKHIHRRFSSRSCVYGVWLSQINRQGKLTVMSDVCISMFQWKTFWNNLITFIFKTKLYISERQRIDFVWVANPNMSTCCFPPQELILWIQKITTDKCSSASIASLSMIIAIDTPLKPNFTPTQFLEVLVFFLMLVLLRRTSFLDTF